MDSPNQMDSPNSVLAAAPSPESSSLSSLPKVLIIMYDDGRKLNILSHISRTLQESTAYFIVGSGTSSHDTEDTTERMEIDHSAEVAILISCSLPPLEKRCMETILYTRNFNGMVFFILAQEYVEKAVDPFLYRGLTCSSQKIFLVENSAEVGQASVYLLHKICHDVIICYDKSNDGLDLLRNHIQEVGLIVVDFGVIKELGDCVLASLKEFNLPIVVALELLNSENFVFRDYEDVLENGALVLLVKPYHEIYLPYLLALMDK